MRLLKIGRDVTCDIVLHSNNVSSLHAELTLLNSGDIMLEDKGSRNGTFIMNRQIKPNTPVSIKRGDAIRFADVELQWSQVPMPEDNSAYQGLYGIGSHFNNDIQISGATVSRYHATVKHGRDGKMYIVDHSKNGTTVDGTKIPSNTNVRIKRSSVVVCGGVPVDLSHLPWPNDSWKYFVGIAASLIIVCGIGFGLKKFWPPSGYSDTELYEKYRSSIVMLKGIYHYEVTVGDLNIEDFNKAIRPYFGSYEDYKEFAIPQKFIAIPSYRYSTPYIDVSNFSEKEFIEVIDEAFKDKGLYSGTGFFITMDGKLLTNLHVVKPWLEENESKKVEELQNELNRKFAYLYERLKGEALPLQISAYLSQVRVKGVLDYIALVPQGEVFDKENIRKCKVLEAGDDIREDVALIQMVSAMPTSCTYIDIVKLLNVSEDAIRVGTPVTSIGFPHGHGLQQDMEKLMVFYNDGKISRESGEFDFMMNLTSAGGASGSPIFNRKGELIGILNSGVKGENFIGAIKAKYIKKILDNSNKK